MLAPPDAAVAARDPGLPGLALVLDPDALAERLARARPDLALFIAQATYVRYKPGTSCLVGFRLDHPGRPGSTPEAAPALVFAKAYRQGDGHKLTKAGERARGGALATFGPELVVVAGVAGDRDLPGARRLQDQGGHGDRRRRLLRRLLPASPDLWTAVPRPLRYKPERRWVGVVGRQGDPVALIKAYRPPRLARAWAGLRFAMQAPVASPRLLGSVGSAGVLAGSWIPGEALGDILARPGAGGEELRAAGEAVAHLHRADPHGLAPVRPDAEARALEAAASMVATIHPSSGRAATRLAVSLARRLGDDIPATGPRHGDLSPDQVVCGPGGVHLVDFDDAGLGAVAADVGQFAAALVATELHGGLSSGAAGTMSGHFLAGYTSAGGVLHPDLVASYTAAALMGLAVEPFRLRMEGWPDRTEALLAAAHSWSAGAVPG